MRIEVGGAQITESVADLLEDIQNDADYTAEIYSGIDTLVRHIVLDLDLADSESMRLIRVLQFVRRDYQILSNPPELDDPANDEPTAQL